MNCKESRFCLVFLAGILSVLQASSAQDPFAIEIGTSKQQMKHGDPLIVSLHLRFEQSQVSEKTGKPLSFINYGGWVLQVQDSNESEPSLYRSPLPLNFRLEDTQGLRYSAKIEVFCHLSKERHKLTKKVVFDKVGNYTLSIMRGTQQRSNELGVFVERSNLGEKALSLLTDPNDFAFLIGGVYKNAESVSRLQKVVSQCKGTLLAKYAAGRLGVEYFKDFHKKHPSFEKFKVKRQRGEVEEPLFDLACLYLAEGLSLPDEFSIRVELLDKLVSTEYIKGNYKEAIRLVDELGSKYPKSKYGKRASRMKAELQELKERE